MLRRPENRLQVRLVSVDDSCVILTPAPSDTRSTSDAVAPAVTPGHRRRLRRLPFVALLCAVLALAAACTPEQEAILQQVTANRANAGAPALLASPHAMTKAQAWADDLARRGVLEHSSLADGMPGGWVRLAENVGRGGSIEAVQGQFLTSPSHRANMLDAGFQWLGTGHAIGADGLVYVVEVFAQY
jgi:uncharacterized protein YkwD